MKVKIKPALLAGLPIATYSQLPERPNIIWLMAEDISTDLECNGMKGVHTPVLNQLAAEGMFFESAYCTASISSPSRSAMMTGVHQNTINAHNHRSNRNLPLTTEVQPITYHLRNNHYTCLLGHSLVAQKGRKIDCNYKTRDVGSWNGINAFGLFDKASDFTLQDQPFFAQIQLVKTHRGNWWKATSQASQSPVHPDSVELPPYMPDHPKVRAQWASYLDQIEYMDHEVGLIMEDLKKKKLLNNTIIIFIGDNGRCDIRGKGYLYEPGIKIPMIVWGKGIQPARIKELVSTLDISATILDLAGCELPDYVMGKPFIEKSTGKFTGGHEYIYSARDNWDEIVDCMRSVTTSRFKYIKNYVTDQGWDCHQQYLEFHRPAIHVMRQLQKENRLTQAQQLFMAPKKPAEELYDLKNDLFELHNLAENPKYKKELQRMRSYLEDCQSKHTDDGLQDLKARLEQSKIQKKEKVSDFVKTHHPDEWEKIEAGEICTKYREYVNEMHRMNHKQK